MIQTAEVTKAIHALLAADVTLAALIADDGMGNPAIYTGSAAPDDAAFTRAGSGSWPYVVITPGEESEPLSLDGDDWLVRRQIELYHERTGDSIPIEAAADRVAEVLDAARLTLSIAGHRVLSIDVDPPAALGGADEETLARVVSVEIVVEQI